MSVGEPRRANIGCCQTASLTRCMHPDRSGSASASSRRWISSSMPTPSSRRALQPHVLGCCNPTYPGCDLACVCVCVAGEAEGAAVKRAARSQEGQRRLGDDDSEPYALNSNPNPNPEPDPNQVMKTPERRRFCLRQGLAQRYWFSENVGQLPFKSKALAASVSGTHPSPGPSSNLSPSFSSNPSPNPDPDPSPNRQP